MKNSEVAESGSFVRAIAIVPRVLLNACDASNSMGGNNADFSFRLLSKPPPCAMKPLMTRWKVRPSKNDAST